MILSVSGAYSIGDMLETIFSLSRKLDCSSLVGYQHRKSASDSVLFEIHAELSEVEN